MVYIFNFGRKDPFPAAGVMTRTSDADIVPVYDASGNKILKNSNQVKSSAITTGIDQAAVKVQLAYTIENPLMFILRDDIDKTATYGGDGTNPSYNWIFAAHPARMITYPVLCLGRHPINCGGVVCRMRKPA